MPTVDFAGWLQRRFCTANTVFAKLAKFEVLEHLIRQGAAQLLDTIAIEWHTSKRAVDKRQRQQLGLRKELVSKQLREAGVKIVEWKDGRSARA